MRAITRLLPFLSALLAFVPSVVAAPSWAQTTDDAIARGNRLAYDSAMTCFVVDGILAGDKREDGDKTQQAAFEEKARMAFEIASKAGLALGYSGTRVNEDFGLAQTREMPRLVRDTAYFKRQAAICKQLGLM